MKRFFRLLADPRPQLFFLAIFALILQAILWIISPVQGPVVLYKLGLPVLAAIVGVFCDVAVFPFARPDSYLNEDWKKSPDADNPGMADYPIARGYKATFSMACIRRAIIVASFVLAVALGL